jgi:hypothetical protein
MDLIEILMMWGDERGAVSLILAAVGIYGVIVDRSGLAETCRR